MDLKLLMDCKLKKCYKHPLAFLLNSAAKGNSRMLPFNLSCKNLHQYKCGKLWSQTSFDQSWNAERKVSAGKYVTARGDKSVQKRGVMPCINARKRDLWRTPGIRRAPHQGTHWYILYRGYSRHSKWTNTCRADDDDDDDEDEDVDEVARTSDSLHMSCYSDDWQSGNPRWAIWF